MNVPAYHAILNRIFMRLGALTLALSAITLLASCGVSDTGTPNIGASNAQQTTAVANPTAVPRNVEANTQAQGTQLRKIHLNKANSGWMLTDRGVWWTNDFTHQWATKILPPQVKPEDIGDVFFLDEQHSWIVLNRPRPGATNAADVMVLRSTDNGRSWAKSSLYPDYNGYVDQPGGNISIDFIDEQVGWVMLQNVSGGADDKGLLFRTTDGGASWKLVSAPSGQPVRFINALDGWTTNIPLAQLYVTHDGGTTWTKQALPGIAEPTAGGIIPSYELPTFFNNQDGVLAVTLAGTQESVNFYTTHDGGQSWSLAATAATTLPGSPIGTIPTAIIAPNEWLLFLPNGIMRKTSDSGKSWQEETVASLASGVTSVSFVSDSHGWGLSAIGKCAAHKSQCSIQTQVVITEDGGHTWTPTTTFISPN